MLEKNPLSSRLKHAWNVFTNKEVEEYNFMPHVGGSMGSRPMHTPRRYSSERSIITSVFTRLSVDASSVDIHQVRLDEDQRFMEEMDTYLNRCLSIGANIDQEGRQFRRDMFMTLLEEGTIAIVPVETSLNPNTTGGYDVKSLRIGRILEWFPEHVRVNLYNEKTGIREDIIIPKSITAIVENPFYSVMNEPNSTLQRLIRKLNILDSIDEQSGSGKLDVIIQLPYVIKSEARQQQAMQRRKDLEEQLRDSQYGVGYVDATERITQLNRPAENNLLRQIEYLTEHLYGQLGLTPEVFNGKADEAEMLNYNNRTIEPLLTAVTEAMHRKFLTQTARSQGQAIRYFRDPFKLVPVNQIAEIADKFTRNEIMSSNEIRSTIGMRPSKDPKADELRNANMPDPNASKTIKVEETIDEKRGELQNGT